MSPDISIVAEPALADVEELLEDNLHKLIPTIGIAPERCERTADCLCQLFDLGRSRHLLAININDGGDALLRAAAIMDDVPEGSDVAVTVLSSQPPPGRRWLQRHLSLTWVRTQVLDVEGSLGLLLDLPAAANTAVGAHGSRSQLSRQIAAATPLVDELTPDEVAFFRHL